MDLDNSLRYLGVFGRYQTLLTSHMLIFTSGFPAALTMIMVFITSEPDMYYCTPPNGFLWNETVPVKDDNGTTNVERNSGCFMYEVHDGILSDNQTSCQYGWEYYFQYGETSIVSEFDLVCDRKLLKETATTTFMTGLLLGALPIGQLADIFGRKITTFASILFLGVTGTGLAFANNYYVFVVLWFLVAVFRQGTMTCGFVNLIEMFPPERRAIVGTMANLAWGIAVIILSLLAYLIGNWRHLQLVLSIGILAALPFWWVIHESVRWLLSQKRHEKAEGILHKIAKFNHVSSPQTFLNVQEVKSAVNNTTFIASKTSKEHAGCKTEDKTQHAEKFGETAEGKIKKLTVLDLFKTRNLAKNTLILNLDWIAAVITYYGLSLNSVNFAGNKYLNFFLLSLVELPAYFLAYISMEHFGGRRLSVSLSVLIAGIFCVITAWIPPTTANGTDMSKAITTFAMIGKFAISYTWGGIVVYTPEVIPTGLRSTANGLFSSLSRVGGMVAPFILRLNDISRYLPLNIFGIVSIVAGLLSFLLPETRNVPLPETIEDGEMIGKRSARLKELEIGFIPVDGNDAI